MCGSLRSGAWDEVVGPSVRPVHLGSMSPPVGLAYTVNLWTSQALRTSSGILGQESILVTELLLHDLKTVMFICSPDFLICTIGSLSKDELSLSHLEFQRTRGFKAHCLMITLKLEGHTEHKHTQRVSSLSDLSEPEENERSWNRLATGSKGQGPI